MKIFYSWQSDLPNKNNRGFIEECIDKAKKKFKGIVAIEADRDIKNNTGAPDIAATIFKKIDECDLFVADISIINKSKHKFFRGKSRPTPNPNVLLELGYAARHLGWDRIICVYNTDYSDLEAVPFDLRQHRITDYSLVGKKRATVRSDLVDAISCTIDGLIKRGDAIRPKGTHSFHKLLGYSFAKGQTSDNAFAYEIGFSALREELIAATISLVDKLNNSGIRFVGKSGVWVNGMHINLDAATIVTIEDSEIREVTGAVKDLLDKDLQPCVFCFGDLKERPNYMQGGRDYEGSDTEKQKHKDYLQLKRYLSEIVILDLFCKPFEDVLMLPLVIKNVSSYLDRNIKIKVTVEGDDFELVTPSQDLINKKLGSNAGFICDYGFVPELLIKDENSGISFDEGTEYTDYFDDSSWINLWDAGTRWDIDDCEEMLCDFVATPSAGNALEFKIGSLQANEAKWLEKVLLIKINRGEVKLKYSITSDNTDGCISNSIDCAIG